MRRGARNHAEATCADASSVNTSFLGTISGGNGRGFSAASELSSAPFPDQVMLGLVYDSTCRKCP